MLGKQIFEKIWVGTNNPFKMGSGFKSMLVGYCFLKNDYS